LCRHLTIAARPPTDNPAASSARVADNDLIKASRSQHQQQMPACERTPSWLYSKWEEI
jgi:hypothetical protein